MNLNRLFTSQEKLHRFSSGGFTLIELLVVIAIIAVLSLIGMSSFQSASRSGRDGKRKGDLSQVQAALELYKSDTTVSSNRYPSGAYSAVTGTLNTAGYLNSPVPNDPKSPSMSYTYAQSGGGSGYCLCAQMENGNGNASGASCPPSGSGSYYCVMQP